MNKQKVWMQGCMITVAVVMVGLCALSAYGFVSLTARALGVA